MFANDLVSLTPILIPSVRLNAGGKTAVIVDTQYDDASPDRGSGPTLSRIALEAATEHHETRATSDTYLFVAANAVLRVDPSTAREREDGV